MRDTRVGSSDGYFLALSELPIPLDTEIAAVTGEPWKIDISGGGMERAIYPWIASEIKLFDKVKEIFIGKIRNIRNNFDANDLLQNQTFGSFLTSLKEFFLSDEYFKYYLSPPLMSMAILDNIPSYKVYDAIRNIVAAIHQASLSGIIADFELVSLREKDEIFKKIIMLRKHTEVWSKAFHIHKELGKKFNLGFII